MKSVAAIAALSSLSFCSHGGADDLALVPSAPQSIAPSGRAPVMATPTPAPHPMGIPDEPGCLSVALTSGPNDGFACGLMASLNGAEADTFFAREQDYQRDFWIGLPANVAVYNECVNGPENAKSFPQHYILFGYYFFWDLTRLNLNYGPVAGVLAHEWGHQAQFRYGWIDPNRTSVLADELEVDAFSGYYMYMSRGESASGVAAYYSAIQTRLGDNEFMNFDHHGTAASRLHMAMFGANLARNAIATGTSYNYPQLHSYFKTEVLQLGPAALLPSETSAEFRRLKDWIDSNGGEDFGPPSIPYEARRPFFPHP